MKKIILIIIGVAVLIIGFVLFKASQLTDLTITKSITINAPLLVVYEKVANLNNFHQWSPFLHQDPKLVYTVEQSSILNWSGGKENKDAGTMKIIGGSPNKNVIFECDIKQPYPSVSTFEYSFSESSTSTTVNQTFKMKSSLINAAFLWIFGVEDDLNSNNELGLELLKKASE